ncbi:MAG TPA: hypothetical protein DDZ68_12840 [Parvularcula sp.]|nr:hypothetical protein [Parvularcula sp.]
MKRLPLPLFVASVACLVVSVARADVIADLDRASALNDSASSAARSCNSIVERLIRDATGIDDIVAARAAADSDYEKALVTINRNCMDVRNPVDRNRSTWIPKAKAAYTPPQPDPTPDPAPNPLPDPDPAPQPAPPPPPVDPVPPPDGIAIDGRGASLSALGAITTPTGAYPAFALGAVTEGKAYLIRDAVNASAFDVCIVRYPGYVSPGVIDERTYSVAVDGATTTVRALPGSMKCLGRDLPSAKPDMARLAKAVADKRVVPYSAAAFEGWPAKPALKADATALNKLGYKPDSIYARSSGSAPSRLAAPIAGSGGEYDTSRGFVSGDDAAMIRAAVEGNAAVFAEAARQTRVQMLYGLSLPHLVIWSTNHDMLRDPQMPLAGDKPYANEGIDASVDNYSAEGNWCAPADYPYLAEIGAAAGTCYGHQRDEAHLFNHGFAYWLATGDPRAAILQQSISAYMLAANYKRAAGSYLPRFAYQRATVNQFNALWTLRDVALHASGPLLWPKPRTDKMIDDVWAGWQKQLEAMDAATDAYSRSATAIRAVDSNGDNAYNTYQIHGYGIEAAYLWALAGRPMLLRRIGEHLIVRFGLIGGTRGYYGHGSGSGFAILKDGALPYDGTTAGLVAWSKTATEWPIDSFDGAPAHYVLRAWWGLKMTAAAVPDTKVEGMTAAAALDVMAAARARTKAWKNAAIIGAKHAGVTF